MTRMAKIAAMELYWFVRDGVSVTHLPLPIPDRLRAGASQGTASWSPMPLPVAMLLR